MVFDEKEIGDPAGANPGISDAGQNSVWATPFERHTETNRWLPLNHFTCRWKAWRKFPEITPRYLNDRIGRFQQLLDRFHGLRAKRMAANLFAIE